MSQSYTCLAPAKINWFLHITGKRDNGYHELSTLFQFVDLADELIFTKIESKQIELSGDLSGVAAEKNLVYKAAQLMRKHFAVNLGIHIEIKKRIPSGAGLGGGSSDAATTMLMLNKLWQINATEQQLLELGAKLGADVPIFIYGQTAFATGIGERLTPSEQPEVDLLLAIPADCHISTPLMFSQPQLKRDSEIVAPADYQFATTRNDFQPVVKEMQPQVAKTLQWLIEYAPSRLTGTGACCFSVVSSKQQAEEMARHAPEGINTFVVKTLKNSPVHLYLAEQFS
ncbi:4-diphosphocytidyl-2-C-methyl-D-erythritol kinase [Catenovulum agarivorans DS-2]|uniref:4-diphosphocytidyl-2-C-methyl-D-erythritol kinase n=1 Tax=Catenovulum agarivorans DS-2 TaxID=1328313 RepID=W7QT66_9ALTE|nr:4-(cytidine 5'-diphospho)-2-C-methyl-D-erythritol kinase [Catenovulum agarivorans]EWH12227.1 4-diphosphocytidyl-2-C-methyl-D-erythritol kinase [Catenovulum agarivorans DS-2]